MLAAETGSGKTLAYLGPVISQIAEGIANGRYILLAPLCLPIYPFGFICAHISMPPA